MHAFIYCLLIFQNHFFKKFFQEYHQSDKQFGSRSGPAFFFFFASSGCKGYHQTTLVGKEIELSYDVASGSEITPCNKTDKPIVVYRFTGNVMTSITTLHT